MVVPPLHVFVQITQLYAERGEYYYMQIKPFFVREKKKTEVEGDKVAFLHATSQRGRIKMQTQLLTTTLNTI